MRLSVDAAGVLALGRGPGRGIYLCPDAACAERARRSGAIPRRLRADVAIPHDLAERVAAGLPGGRKPLG